MNSEETREAESAPVAGETAFASESAMPEGESVPALDAAVPAANVDAVAASASDASTLETGVVREPNAPAAEVEASSESSAPKAEAEVVPPSPVGLGIDLVDIARMKGVLERTPHFAQKVFSPDERAYCDARAHPEAHYATRFAAKEAVVKALGTGFAAGMTVRDIEVVLNAKGAPRVVLRGRVAEVAREQGVVSMPISLSFTHTEAVACALALTSAGAAPAKRRAEDPLRELDARFKEARALLDEL